MSSELDYSRYYKRYHTNTPEHREWMLTLYKELFSHYLPKKDRSNALDIGCGMGFAMSFLIDQGFQSVEGIDIDGSQVEACQSNGLNVSLVEDSTKYLASYSDHFSIIFALDVLEHMSRSEQLRLVHGIYEALQPGARFICSVPNANSSIASRQRFNDFTHHNIFTEESLDFLLFNSGFTDIEIGEFDYQKPVHRKGIGLDDFAKRRHFFSFVIKDLLHWVLFSLMRLWQRMILMGEYGFDRGGQIPLSFSLLGVATKDED